MAPDASPRDPPSRARRPFRAPHVGALAVLLAAAAGGVLLERATDGSPRTRPPVRMSSSQMSLEYQAPWVRVLARTVPGLKLDHAVTLRSADDGLELVAGTARVSRPNLLPAAFSKTVAISGARERVRLGSTQGLRYRELAPKGGAPRFSLVVVPTRSTAVYLVCRRLDRSVDASDRAACDALGQTMELKEGARALAPSESYAQRLDRAVAALRSVHRTTLAQLSSASDVTGQASALATARDDCRTRVQAIRSLPAGPQERVPQQQLAEAADRLCADFTAMASAAKSYNRSKYARAAAHSSASARAIASAVRAFRAAGYTPR